MITASEFHPKHCSTFVYSSSKGTIRLCDMRAAALCDQHAKSESTHLPGRGSADRTKTRGAPTSSPNCVLWWRLASCDSSRVRLWLQDLRKGGWGPSKQEVN